MSIYSGFPTRKDETIYNNLLLSLLKSMQCHLLQIYSSNSDKSRQLFPEVKVLTYNRILYKMKQYEDHKYLPPKFSQALQPLLEYINQHQTHNQQPLLEYINQQPLLEYINQQPNKEFKDLFSTNQDLKQTQNTNPNDKSKINIRLSDQSTGRPQHHRRKTQFASDPSEKSLKIETSFYEINSKIKSQVVHYGDPISKRYFYDQSPSNKVLEPHLEIQYESTCGLKNGKTLNKLLVKERIQSRNYQGRKDQEKIKFNQMERKNHKYLKFKTESKDKR